ncbi:MAG TPA: lytic transglycosylase domain-containing protein [Myxococcaceae bacterium]|nr:lytic transglycosylase domain-containing protein [Myxococcaceae bacterium]
MRALVLLLLFSAASPASASAVYTYTQKDGTIVYTNVPPAGVKARKLSGQFRAAPRPSDPPAPVVLSDSLIEEWIARAAAKYNIPLPLVRAVMHAESNFDRFAVSPKGASGLMQLMPGTARAMYVRDIFDVQQNIEGGVRYLRILANEFGGQMEKMLAAYNAGPEAVRRFEGNIPPYDETQTYVRKVLALYYMYKEQAQAAAAPTSSGRATWQ